MKTMRFAELDATIKQALLSTTQENNHSAFIRLPIMGDKKAIFQVIILISLGSTLMLFLYGILSDKIAFNDVIKWSAIWLIFISVGSTLGFRSKYKWVLSKSPHSALLLSRAEIIYYYNDDNVFSMPIEETTFSFEDDSHSLVGFSIKFSSQQDSFSVKYEDLHPNLVNGFLAELAIRNPSVKNEIGKFNEIAAKTASIMSHIKPSE